uniref:Uncharacterized protein n=1 Tax=mine drainage metagenome TaxID=410659 RepID=E6PDP3_9ZZZZ
MSLGSFRATHRSPGSSARCCSNKTTSGNSTGGTCSSKEWRPSAIINQPGCQRSLPADADLAEPRLVHHSAGHDREYRLALADFSRAIAIDATDASGYEGRAQAEILQGHPEAALADYASAIRIDPKSPYGHASRGNLYFERGSYAFAARDLARANQITIFAKRIFTSANGISDT